MKKYLLLSVVLLTACAEKVPMEIVDQNQIISRENASLNARAYVRAMNWEGVNIAADSDSTISTQCRFGDGWATVKVMRDGANVAKLKCQTTGMGKGLNGCLIEADFAKKDYASQDGRCDSTITSLPKLNK